MDSTILKVSVVAKKIPTFLFFSDNFKRISVLQFQEIIFFSYTIKSKCLLYNKHFIKKFQHAELHHKKMNQTKLYEYKLW